MDSELLLPLIAGGILILVIVAGTVGTSISLAAWGVAQYALNPGIAKRLVDGERSECQGGAARDVASADWEMRRRVEASVRSREQREQMAVPMKHLLLCSTARGWGDRAWALGRQRLEFMLDNHGAWEAWRRTETAERHARRREVARAAARANVS